MIETSPLQPTELMVLLLLSWIQIGGDTYSCHHVLPLALLKMSPASLLYVKATVLPPEAVASQARAGSSVIPLPMIVLLPLPVEPATQSLLLIPLALVLHLLFCPPPLGRVYPLGMHHLPRGCLRGCRALKFWNPRALIPPLPLVALDFLDMVQVKLSLPLFLSTPLRVGHLGIFIPSLPNL